jgi:two-component system, cell cycle sensor histidine kinase and response regulator CckA
MPKKTTYQEFEKRFELDLEQAGGKKPESDIRLRLIFNAINDAVFLHPLLEEGFAPFVEVNDTACHRYGYKREEMLRLSAADITKKEDLDIHSKRDHRKKLHKTRRLIFESTHITKRGREFPVEINSSVVEIDGHSMILAVVRDISERKQAETERKQLQNQLIQSQKMEAVGRLAGGIAHDFNNMLGVILGQAELAMIHLDTSKPIYKNLEEIHKAANRSARLTKQLLGFARKQTIVPQALDLNKAVTDMLDMLNRMISEYIDLAFIPADNLWLVKIDPSQIDQVIANLCVNACDAITGEGKVTIKTSNIVLDDVYCREHTGCVPGEYVLVAVSDNGCGIDKETLKNIFEPFFTTKNVGKGTGLGLSTVYGIVKQNNGFINVYSNPGQGSTFEVYLPHHTGKAEQARKEGLTRPGLTGHETILLVEDEPAILNMTMMMLQRLGYEVLCASSPAESLRTAEAHTGPIDLLITDVIMPEMNGHDLAKHLSAFYPNMKRLFMSGYTANVIVDHGVLDTGIHFIQKPFTIQVLATKVRDVLDETENQA